VSELDLLVVGGGPVGVTTALLAAHRGLRARVLERSTDVHPLPRAVVMDDEVQRVFQGVGLSAGLAAITTPLRGAEFVTAAGERIMGLEAPEPVIGPLGHHPVVCYDQPELEAWLRGEALAAGVDLRLGTNVTGVGQDAGAVWADTPDGRHEAAWLVAADGAGSPTRKALGLTFEDQGYDQEWLVVDLEATADDLVLPDLVQQVCDPARLVTYVPGHGRYRRWEFQLQAGEDATRMTEPGAVWALLEGWVRPDQAELRRAVVYRFHATVARCFRAGRAFLAGDAAHQMPPFLGQGLCSGIRDAANLAWKLVAVTRGEAGDRLLDTYDAERRPHAAGVVAHAVEAGRLIDRLAGRIDEATDDSAGYGGGRPFPHLVDGLVRGDHPAVGRQLPQPWAGWDDRLGSGWSVLAHDPAAVATAGSLGAVLVVPGDGELSDLVGPHGGVIVRPDRYVAAVAPTGDDLLAAGLALASLAGVRAAAGSARQAATGGA
jgi:3-(3-hydroxy-phenyl)propionate hydroxylase